MHRAVLAWQGLYFVATGLWGLVSLRSFMAVTGPKTDTWLVRTVSVLVVAIGSVLLLGARRRDPAREVDLLALGSGFGLAAVEVITVAKGRIRPVYLLDAAEQMLVMALLLRSWRREE
jgi:hypothetical protein